MPENKYIKKVVQKDGSVKIYEYTQNWEKYHENKKLNHPKIACPICNKIVNPWNMDRHRLSKKCTKRRMEDIKIDIDIEIDMTENK